MAVYNLEACKADRFVIWGSSDKLVKNCGGILVDYKIYGDMYVKCAGVSVSEILIRQWSVFLTK